MQFLVFIFLLWTAALFHRQEHRRLAAELSALPRAELSPAPARVAGHDWRIVGGTENRIYLRRAFDARGLWGWLRYMLPVLLLALMMIVLQSWATAGIYGAFLALRWFCLRVELDRPPRPAAYEATLFGYRLFGGPL